MLKRLVLNNFTVFGEAEFEFSPDLNVVVGANGTGKSHLLKLGYACSRFSHENLGRESSVGEMQRRMAETLRNLFLPDQLGRLTRRAPGHRRAEVTANFYQSPRTAFRFSFATNSKSEVAFSGVPRDFVRAPALFLPTKEAMSLFPGFIPLYETRHISMDETYYDLCKALSLPLLRGRRFTDVKTMMAPVEEILGGTVESNSGRFQLRIPGEGILEMPLVAEGLRKLAMIAYLLANGSLTKNGALFWDEPETNLNPHLIRKVARLIFALADSGIQVNLATHSLFLLRELELLAKSEDFGLDGPRFFALARGEAGVEVRMGDDVADVDPLVLLDEELKQSERYQDLQWLP